jgi:hypothetical protein
MDLYLRKVVHHQASDNYRVILKGDQDEVELGSIGIQRNAGNAVAWHWGIDTVLPMREMETSGQGRDRADCMRQFKAAWTRFSSDQANLVEFLAAKRRPKRR